MLRITLIKASESRWLHDRVAAFPPTRRVVDKFVAGEGLDDGLAAVRALARQSLTGTLDYLGEAVTTPAEAEAAAEVYVEALSRIGALGLDCGVSVKPTQMGLGLDDGTCAELFGRIAKAAGDAGVHLTIDMEDSSTTEATVCLVERLVSDGHVHAGCALQAYLHRSADDLRLLSEAGASLRWCKGAYAEPADIAWQSRTEVSAAYARGAKILFDHGHHPRFATHDDALIDRIVRYARHNAVPADAFEFQMLYGVRPSLQQALVADGWRVRVYVPFGEQWYPYFMRRLAERPANVVFFLRALRDT